MNSNVRTATEPSKSSMEQPLIVNLPDQNLSRYVNTRGASLNYVKTHGSNKESAYCADRND